MNKSISYIVTSNLNITAFLNGRTYAVPHDFPTHAEAVAALKAQDPAAFVSAVDAGERLRLRSKGTVTLQDGVVLFAGQQVHSVIVDRILVLVDAGFDVSPMTRFLENCLRNIEPRAIDELYLFLEANALPLTEDGWFLAYRRVDKDYLSIHANPDGTKNSNKVGETCFMLRTTVDTDRDRTCSKGLHACSMTYLPHYGSASNGDRTMVVKISPADVISIPSDYANQKLRCCRYVVVAEHLDGDTNDTLATFPVWSVTETGITPIGAVYQVNRDSRGRFQKK